MKFIILVIIIISSVPVYADNMCFERAAVEYRVSPDILKAISRVESNHNPRAYNTNKNSTVDIGHMQINSVWISVLKQNYNYLYNPCYSTRVGAWVLRQCMDQYGNTWDAIACYNTGPKNVKSKKGKIYAYKINRALAEGGYK
jgi:soluble lytic murein transglycosylase-like protein